MFCYLCCAAKRDAYGQQTASLSCFRRGLFQVDKKECGSKNAKVVLYFLSCLSTMRIREDTF